MDEALSLCAERLAREVIDRAVRTPDARLYSLELHIAEAAPDDAFRRAFELALADGGIEFVDLRVVHAGPACRVSGLWFGPP
jgi:hypothetical protein